MSDALTLLPADSKARKEFPLYSGVIKYFPDALLAISHVSYVGNVQHNGPDAPLHWAKEKSADEPDALMRHLAEVAAGQELDSDGVPLLWKIGWRALAFIQRDIDAKRKVSQAVIKA
jgi:hypothetical protein